MEVKLTLLKTCAILLRYILQLKYPVDGQHMWNVDSLQYLLQSLQNWPLSHFNRIACFNIYPTPICERFLYAGFCGSRWYRVLCSLWGKRPYVLVAMTPIVHYV